MLPASIVLVSQQEARMKEMLSLKLVFFKIAVDQQCPALLLLYYCSGPKINLWARHAELKYMMRFKNNSMLQCIFPQLHSALLECSFRALVSTLSITKHLERLQSMHLHAHSHVIFSWKASPFPLPFSPLPLSLHPFELQPPGNRAQTLNLTTCAVPSSKEAEYTVKNKKETQAHTHFSFCM